MKYRKFLWITAFLLTLVGYAQEGSEEGIKGSRIAFLGIFHFGSTSDLMSLQPGDILGVERQEEIISVVEKLSRYKPTKIVLEFPFGNNKLDSLYQQYLKAEHPLTINERQQLGFRLGAKLGHEHIYVADHRMDLPFEDLQNFLVETGKQDFFPNFLSKMKTEVIDVWQNKYDTLTLSEFLAFMNQDEFDRLNKAFYLQHMNQLGTEANPVGVALNAKWWERNMRIMHNIDKLTKDGDKILVLFGQGHTAILKDFYTARSDVQLDDILGYLD
nr:DUF5694 domain-containing protein [uncultured Allomuricauda sp.]